jgi:phage terminase small subunit
MKRQRTPRPPKHLDTAGKALFAELVREYSIDDPAGLALLAVAGECLDRMRAAQKAIEQHGEVVTDRYKQVKVNPACALEKDSRNGFLASIRALNLDLEPLRDRVGRPGIGGFSAK